MAETQYTYSDIERHPLQPFRPANAQILMLGSFPPPKERWCMDFFYPNPQNDMWRIVGLFWGATRHFLKDKGTMYNVQRQIRKCSTVKRLSLSAKRKALLSSTLGGYAYGIELKRHLLEWEKNPTETFTMRTRCERE